MSILQLQKKYREQHMPYSFAFIDLNKAFDQVGRDDLTQRGRITIGLPHLKYKDVCMRDMKAVNVDAMSWERLVADHTRCSTLSQPLAIGVRDGGSGGS